MKRRLSVFLVILSLSISPTLAQYSEKVDVLVVNLQVSVSDQKGDYIKDLRPEDFSVWENSELQEVLDLELEREPFSVGVIADTSSSMQSTFLDVKRASIDFIYSLHPEDEFFLMAFDDDITIQKDFTPAALRRSFVWQDLRYGDSTRLFDALVSAIHHLENAKYPRRALFLISDGQNTFGESGLSDVIELAQRNKVIVYSLILERADTNLNVMRLLSESTGGTYFVSHKDFPRLHAAYKKIATDLANRFTLYYRSRSDYSKPQKPEIKVRMNNPHWRVRFQKTYYPGS